MKLTPGGVTANFSHVLSALVGAVAAVLLIPVGKIDLNVLRTIEVVSTSGDGTISSTTFNPLGLAVLGFTAILIMAIAAALLSRLAPTLGRRAAIKIMPAGSASTAGLLVETELKRTLGYLRSHGIANDRYDHALTSAQARLAALPQSEQVRVVVKLLVAENERMRLTSAELKSKLFDSERKLKQLQQDLGRVEQLSLSDPLTGVGNRRRFEIDLEKAIELFRTKREPLSLVFCDIDHFKAINDKHGHTVGDEVLKVVAKVIEGNVRAQDTVVRHGGEEFAVILKGSSEDAAALAERIRVQIEAQDLTVRASKEKLGRITASFGVAQVRSGETSDEFIERADASVYNAKRSGRNTISRAS